MKSISFWVFAVLFFTNCSSFKHFAKNKDIKAVYLHTFFYVSSPFSVDEYNIQFIDSSTLITYRITNSEFIEQIAEYLSRAEPSKGFHYQDVWIGVVLATENQQMKIGLTKEGFIKRGNKYYTMTDDMMILILSKLHPRLKEGITENSKWGKALALQKTKK